MLNKREKKKRYAKLNYNKVLSKFETENSDMDHDVFNEFLLKKKCFFKPLFLQLF